MKNPALSADEARKLKFPRLMEVWDVARHDKPNIKIVCGIAEDGQFIDWNGTRWYHAAEPPAELIESMREQFAFKPQRMLVWDDDESSAEEKIVIHDLGERLEKRYIVVQGSSELEYKNGNRYDWSYYRNAKPIPETKTDPVAEEIADLKRRLAELEAKTNKP